MTAPLPPDPRPAMSAPGLLTADARRALALHAGGDLAGPEAAAADKLAADCPHCRGYLADVRAGLGALAAYPADAADSGLWPAVRAALPHVELAADPPPASAWNRFAAPATALTAACVLIGAFAAGPGLLPTGGDDGAVSVQTIRGERVTLPAGTVKVWDAAGRPYYKLPTGGLIPAAR